MLLTTHNTIFRSDWSHRVFFLNNRAEKNSHLLYQPDIVTEIEEVASTAKPVVRAIKRIPKRLRKLIELLPQEEVYAFLY